MMSGSLTMSLPSTGQATRREMKAPWGALHACFQKCSKPVETCERQHGEECMAEPKHVVVETNAIAGRTNHLHSFFVLFQPVSADSTALVELLPASKAGDLGDAYTAPRRQSIVGTVSGWSCVPSLALRIMNSLKKIGLIRVA